jgi:hypothetical protein
VRSETQGRRGRPPLRGRFPCTGADLAAARACEESVFARRFGNDAAELAAAYGPFEPWTAFGAVLRPDGTAVGSVRLLRGGPDSRLKTLVDAGGPPWGLAAPGVHAALGGEDVVRAHTWDVATFAVDRNAAGADPRVAVALLSVMFGAFRDNDVRVFVAMLDLRARRAFLDLGMRLLDLPGAGSAPYLGSPATVPVYRRVDELHAEHAERFPHVHEQIFHGRGIDDFSPASQGPRPLARLCVA